MLQHADDCTNFVDDKYSYDELLKAFTLFGKISGSKINPDKLDFTIRRLERQTPWFSSLFD